MAVFFKNTNARLGQFVGVMTVFIAIMALVDGFVAGAGILAIAGAVLFRLESGRNSALVAFLIRVGFLGMVFVGLMFIVG